MYFCGLCAYSTIGKAHLAIHAYLIHDVQPVPWHQHPGSAEPPISNSETKSLVRPKEYVCALSKDCRFKCLTTAMFHEHLKQCHWGFKGYVCHLCLAHADSSSRLLEHYRCDHAFFKVHCLYCNLGGDDDWVIMRHIMEEHSYKPFRLLLRNGDSLTVVQELRQLAVEYLTKEPVQRELPPQPLVLTLPLIKAYSSESRQITPDICGAALEEEIAENNPTSFKHTVEMDMELENECVLPSCEHSQREKEIDHDQPAPSITETGLCTFSIAENNPTNCNVNANHHTVEMDMGLEKNKCLLPPCEHAQSEEIDHDQPTLSITEMRLSTFPIPENNRTSCNVNANHHTVEMDMGLEGNECLLPSCELAQSEEIDHDQPTPSITEMGLSTFPIAENNLTSCNVNANHHTVEMDMGLEKNKCLLPLCERAQSEEIDHDQPTPSITEMVLYTFPIAENNPTSCSVNENWHTVETDMGLEGNECLLPSCELAQSEEIDHDQPTPSITEMGLSTFPIAENNLTSCNVNANHHTVEMDMGLEKNKCLLPSCERAQSEEIDHYRPTSSVTEMGLSTFPIAETNPTSCSVNENWHTVEMDTGLDRNECLLPSCEHAQNEKEIDHDRPTLSATEIAPSTFPGKQQFSCNIEDCSMEYGDVFDFMNHLAECHPLQSSLNCPKCGFFVSVIDLLSHIVERHSGILFCPYKDCSFGSTNQCDVDNHIIQMHQIYQDEQGKADQAVAARKAEFCAPNILSSSTCAETEGCKDTVDFEPGACYENGKADEQYDASQAESADDLTTRKYFCDVCSTCWDSVLSYICHMTTLHAVTFFCGHCLKSYKKSRCLLMHAGYHHVGQPFSVWSLQDGKVVDVGMQVAPSWVDEAQHYLKGASRSRLKAKGKTMIKNLKKAIDFVTSSCVGSEVEQPQCSAMPTHADGNRRPSATQEMPAQHTEPMVNCIYADDGSLFKAEGGPTLQDQALSEPLSSLGVHSDNSTDEPSEESNISTSLPYALKGAGMASITSVQPQESILEKKPCIESQGKLRGRFRLKILASAFIDAAACKKVNGSIVIDEKVLQKLSELNTMPTPGRNSTKVPSSLLSGEHEGSHVCSECFISFVTFERLCKHIVKTHGATTASDIDSAGAVVSLGDWAPQEFTSISNTFRSLQFFPSGHIKVENSRNNVMLHLKQIKSKYSKRQTITENLFVRHFDALVPYSQFASTRNLNPVVRLVRLPVIKQEKQ
ncbi:uncharacterized protein [Dermacentor albipictus]|uniref:uncharacterized protein isoform X1 n=1 Tax=Dermacentor albipictus TaxID=60249 RepID=UPI0038FCD247